MTSTDPIKARRERARRGPVMTAGRVFRIVRKAMGVTQQQAADHFGVSRSWLGRIERGDRYGVDEEWLSLGYGSWLAELSSKRATEVLLAVGEQR